MIKSLLCVCVQFVLFVRLGWYTRCFFPKGKVPSTESLRQTSATSWEIFPRDVLSSYWIVSFDGITSGNAVVEWHITSRSTYLICILFLFGCFFPTRFKSGSGRSVNCTLNVLGFNSQNNFHKIAGEMCASSASS